MRRKVTIITCDKCKAEFQGTSENAGVWYAADYPGGGGFVSVKAKLNDCGNGERADLCLKCTIEAMKRFIELKEKEQR